MSHHESRREQGDPTAPDSMDEFVERVADAVVRRLDETRKIELIAAAVIDKLRGRHGQQGVCAGPVVDTCEGRGDDGQ